MNYEIDMMAVGNADAMVLRYIYRGNESVVVIDGGNPGDGQRIVDHIKRNTVKRSIDLMICTHPHKDHLGGLFDVIDQLPTTRVWIHDPVSNIFQFDRSISSQVSVKSLLNQESVGLAYEFIRKVDQKRIIREEPFCGLSYGPLRIIWPTVGFYKRELAKFSGVLDVVENPIGYTSSDLLEELMNPSKLLDQENDTSGENNSSAIILANMNGQKLLFTGDSGPEMLWLASCWTDTSNLTWLKIPHHGSRLNLMTGLIKHFRPQFSYISAKGSRKHPSRAVLNELSNCGKVYCTTRKGVERDLLFQSGLFLPRQGYEPAVEVNCA